VQVALYSGAEKRGIAKSKQKKRTFYAVRLERKIIVSRIVTIPDKRHDNDRT
jgi:hypothetical protein